MRSYEFEVFADYFNFSVEDDGSDDYVDPDAENWIAVGPGRARVTLTTARNMDVPVAVEVHEAEPPTDLDDWDRVTESSLEVASGKLMISGNEYAPDAPRIELAPGHYRLRASYGQLDSVSEDGLDGDDHYRIQLWPGEPLDARVRKAPSRAT